MRAVILSSVVQCDDGAIVSTVLSHHFSECHWDILVCHQVFFFLFCCDVDTSLFAYNRATTHCMSFASARLLLSFVLLLASVLKCSLCFVVTIGMFSRTPQPLLEETQVDGNVTIRTAPWSFRRGTCPFKIVLSTIDVHWEWFNLFLFCFADSLQIVVAHLALLTVMYYHIS